MFGWRSATEAAGIESAGLAARRYMRKVEADHSISPQRRVDSRMNWVESESKLSELGAGFYRPIVSAIQLHSDDLPQRRTKTARRTEQAETAGITVPLTDLLAKS